MRNLMLLVVASLGLGACPDTEKRLDEFVDRSEAFRGVVTIKGCEGDRGDISGDYLIAAGTTLSPSKPLLLDTTIAVDEVNWTITVEMDALSALDLPRVSAGGALMTGTADIAEDGSWTVDFGDVEVPGPGNPLTGSDIATSLTLSGCAIPAEAVCGGLGGIMTAPLDFDLTGSTWGTVRINEPDDLNAEPVSKCP